MTVEHLGRLWTVVGAVTFYFAVNSVIVFSGGQPVLDIDLVYEVPIPAQIIALHVLPVLIVTLCTIGRRYAGKYPNLSWAGRMPVVGLSNLDVSQRDAHVYQAAFLVAFIVLPIYAELHFLYQIKDLWVIDARTKSATGVLTAFMAEFGFGSIPDNSHSISESRALMKGNYVTWFPVLSPLLVGTGGVAAVAVTGVYLRALFR
jgi:hypothetical protein